VASEPALADVLSGDLPRFELAWINREMADGRTSYLTMVELPYRDEKGQIAGLLHLVQDSTEAGILQQQLSQHRNELRLAQNNWPARMDLAAANAAAAPGRAQVELCGCGGPAALAARRDSVRRMLADEDVSPLSEGQRQYLETSRTAHGLLHLTSSLLDVIPHRGRACGSGAAADRPACLVRGGRRGFQTG
jgi:hypothetical protein